MRIEWIGHACFLIPSEAGLSIVTDPYETGFRDIMSYDPVNVHADIVTISHEHGDHNHVQAVNGKPQVVRGTGSQTVKGLQFKGIASYHDSVQGAQRGPNTIFTFAVDGINVTHLGDLGHPITPETLAELKGTDVLLAPTGGPGATMELQETIDLWEDLKPALVIPMHFSTAKCTFPKYNADDLVNLRPAARKTGTSYLTLSENELPSPVEILVLDYSR
ncbi:MAG TPA: MBL fold metallo-hydrolase [Dehalococcoidia bacterium]|nr:MBL fold metallo-hydrolase [Dehalococcoidia bacterium]